MSSSLFINTLYVCFESVLAMDNDGMVAMFGSLVATRLKGFLGCPIVIHEAALLEFLANGSFRDGLVVSTVNGVSGEIYEQLLAETFELPVEGLTDLLEIPKDLVFDAKSIVSFSGEPVSISGNKKEMKVEFRLLCDILAKTISVKAGSFDAITQEKFLMMAAIISNLCPAVPLQMIAPIPVVPTEQPPVPKRKTQKRKRRLILGSDDEIVDSEPVVGGSIVGEAAAEVVDDTAEKDVEPVVESVGISKAETVVVEPVSLPAVADILNEGISTGDEVDIIIEQVIAETAQIDTDVGDQDVVTSEVGDKAAGTADEFELWFNLSSEEIQARLDADRHIETASDTDEEFIADQVFGTGVEEMQTEDVEQMRRCR
ncbi:hypothetical protein F511_39427 [Dorcoceras hygrometricum]|uniref:Dystroglycan-like n=1 Tax=Dorcoceras hygrometricum TaxID=472368 RepID=A0A2Z7BJ28_9LAMI|nr:hypothetical protein F511_39427 [Dorcoceras hygrometricum]